MFYILRNPMGISTFAFFIGLVIYLFTPMGADAYTMVYDGTITADTTWTASSSPYIVTNQVTVATGTTLTIEPGVVVKIRRNMPNEDASASKLLVAGALMAEGTDEAPVIFTSIEDPVAEIPSNIAFGTWSTIGILPGGSTTLSHVHVRNGSGFYNRGVLSIDHALLMSSMLTTQPGSDSTVSSTEFVLTGSNALQLYGGYIHLSSVRLTGQGFYGISISWGAHVDSYDLLITAPMTHEPISLSDGFFTHASTTITGSSRNGIFIPNNAIVPHGTHWTPDTVPYILAGDAEIPTGATVTIEPGTVVKSLSLGQYTSGLKVSGTLDLNGEKDQPITFTHIADDTLGGDTDGNGFSAPGTWKGIRIQPGGEVRAQHAHIGYAETAFTNYGKILSSYLTIATSSIALLQPSDTIGSNGSFALIHSRLLNNTTGIQAYGGAGGSYIQQSSIIPVSPRGTGVRNNSTNRITATHNWWNDPSGPYDLLLNPLSHGASVGGNVTFDPALTYDPFSMKIPPTLSALNQFALTGGGTPIAEGGVVEGNRVVLEVHVDDVDSVGVHLEFELKPIDTAWDGASRYITATVTPNISTSTVMSLKLDEHNIPAEGVQKAFHWRVRAVDSEGNASEWQEFGEAGTTDFTATYTLGQAASDWARQLVDQPDAYELGARGWVYHENRFATPEEIVNGYTYKKGGTHNVVTGPGIDCSGLIYWAFNKSNSPHATNPYDNYVADITADGMFGDKQSDTISGPLQPGDALFFDNDSDPQIDHVAMYVGESGGYDVVNAGSDATGITRESKSTYTSPAFGFKEYRRIHQNGFEGHFASLSPVDLIVTDPEGNTLSYDAITRSDEELIREIPGKLYYSEIQKGHDDNSIDIVYIPVLKEGVYHVEVVPDPAAGSNETYSLEFTTGSTTVELAHDVPLSLIPQHGYNVVVNDDHSISFDTIPPEVRIAFSTTTKQIMTTGVDDVASTIVSTTSTSTVVSDVAGNTLTLSILKNIQQPRHAALIVPSFGYSTGTTTNATTSLRYFWSTNASGKYTFFISAIRTPTERIIALYTSLTKKTYILTSKPADDNADLSLQTALLLLRKRIKTYDGLVIPSITTDKGHIIINTP